MLKNIIILICLTLALPSCKELASSATDGSLDDSSYSISVLSYNVRHETSSDDCSGATPCPYLWANREENIASLISSKNPDIFGVQEASSESIQTFLEQSFSGEYNAYRPTGGSPKYIFFKNKFTLMDQGGFYYQNPYAVSDSCRSNAAGRTASWVKLQNSEAQNSELIVINTHWAHGASCSLGREEAANELINFISQINSENSTLIVFGDFNIDPSQIPGENSIVNLLTSTGLTSTTDMSPATAQTATYNSSWKNPSTSLKRLDYILFRAPPLISMTPTNYLVDQTILNGISPSDHFPISADLQLKPLSE